ncbi:MAG: hypothetical protein M3Y59_05580 [Myxococcota bacterium]|nr:hypothetical protein [Myxococcota bacterium]
MSEIRVSRDALTSLVRDASRQIEQVAGTAVGKQAEALLSEVTQSVFQDAKGPGKVADRLPSALEQLSTQLKGLGIDAATVGEVLNRLGEQLAGAHRQMRPGKTLKSALAKNKGLLEDADEELQEAIDSQADAAELLARFAEAKDLATKGRFGKV